MKKYLITAVLLLCAANGKSAEEAAVKVTDICNIRFINVPLTRQARDYTCGVAAAQSVLGFFGFDLREDSLYDALKPTTQDGTLYENMETTLNSYGIKTEIKLNASLEDLRKSLDSGHPALVLLQAWGPDGADYSQDWNDGHFSLAIGYGHNAVCFMDPSTLGYYTYIPNDEFMTRWHDVNGPVKTHRFLMSLSGRKSNYKPAYAIRMR